MDGNKTRKFVFADIMTDVFSEGCHTHMMFYDVQKGDYCRVRENFVMFFVLFSWFMDITGSIISNFKFEPLHILYTHHEVLCIPRSISRNLSM